MKMLAVFILCAVLSLACATFTIPTAASLNNRIVGGQIAEDGQFPYEVSLRYPPPIDHICGGSIINDQWILTAAHCVDGRMASLMSVVTGTNTLNNGGDTYRVFKYIRHENYTANEDTAVFDVAVIKLLTKISFNEKVQPIPLNSEEIPAGSDLLISGWGLESWSGNAPSNVLQYLQVKAVGTKECQESFKYLELDVNDAQLCAFSRYGEGACNGDSGSPLVYNGKVAGIASWTEKCGIGYPDVYTKVSKYVHWIAITIWLEG